MILDRVQQTSTTSGLGPLTLDGTVSGGFRTFAGAGYTNNDPVQYCVVDGNNFEVIEGLFQTTGPALTRVRTLASSTGSPINFSGAAKQVFVVEAAETMGVMGGRLCFVVATNVGNAYTATYKPGAISLVDGMRGTFRAPARNTAAVTLALNALAAKNVRKINGYPLVDGDWKLGQVVEWQYDLNSDTIVWINAPEAAGVKTISATTYTMLAEDFGRLLIFTSITGCAVTQPQATATNAFAAPWYVDIVAQGGAVTITPTTSQIDNAASLVVPAGSGLHYASNDTNYFTQRGMNSTSSIAVIADGRNLISQNVTATPNSQVQFTADELNVKDASNAARQVLNVSNIGDITLAGVSGLDTGAEAASTWYYLWEIDWSAPRVNVAVTGASGTDRITDTAHNMPANAPVKFGGTPPAPLATGTTYYIRDVTTNDYKVAATPNGAAIDLTTNGTGVTVSTVPALLLSASATAPTMPSGFTFKALVGPVYNDGASNFRKFVCNDRVCEQEPVNILANVAVSAAGTFQSLSISVAVPPMAKSVGGNQGVSSTNTDLDLFLAVAGNASKVGQKIACSYNYGNTALSGFKKGSAFDNVPLPSTQTIFWTANTTSAFTNIEITSFTF